MSGFSTMDRIIAIAKKLDAARTGYNGFNQMELAEWLQHDAPELLPLAMDNRQYMEEILEPEYPDQQRGLNFEIEKAIEEGLYASVAVS